jgi:hypothetical protein
MNYYSFTVKDGGISNTELSPSSTLSGAILISSIKKTPPFLIAYNKGPSSHKKKFYYYDPYLFGLKDPTKSETSIY